jgi:hypothetical protein
VQHHLEPPEIGDGGLDHSAAAQLIAGVGGRRERASVPVQDRRLQDANRQVVRLAERGLEVLPRLVDEAGGVSASAAAS